MGIFRLTDVSDNSRATKRYWDARVTRDWATPYHGLYGKGHQVSRMDERNEAVIKDILGKSMRGSVRVLECACGYGRNANVFAPQHEYIGIDLADLNITEARRRTAERQWKPYVPEFIVADMATFRQEDTFDLIFMVAAWSSIEQSSAEILANLKSQLRPGGKIAIFEENLYMVIDR